VDNSFAGPLPELVDQPAEYEIPRTVTHQVVRLITAPHGKRRVEIYRRPDGSYGFCDLRWDEVESCFVPSGRYSESVTQSMDEAVAEASSRVEWLAKSVRSGFDAEEHGRQMK
jgi:hypothetical protein